MNKLLLLFSLLIIFAGCEDDTEGGVYTRNEPGEQFINRSKGTTIDVGDIESGKIFDNFTVTAIAFDKVGNTWIGTSQHGLIKYNSQEAVVFNSSNSFFSNKIINSIAVDHINNIWIGSDALIKYDGEKFIRYDKQSAPIQSDIIHSINIDTDDNIWFSSSQHQQGGIIKFDGNKTWRVITPNNSNLPGNMITGIAIDKNNEVWAGISGIPDSRLINIKNDQITQYTNNDLGFTPYKLGSLKMNSRNELYITIDYLTSSSTHPDGPHLFVFDGKSTKQLSYDDKNFSIKSIFIDNKDNVWCTGSKYITVYNGENWITKDKTEENTVFVIEQAPNGKIWVGTEKGIYIIDPE